jgi:hypothetical protein
MSTMLIKYTQSNLYNTARQHRLNSEGSSPIPRHGSIVADSPSPSCFSSSDEEWSLVVEVAVFEGVLNESHPEAVAMCWSRIRLGFFMLWLQSSESCVRNHV